MLDSAITRWRKYTAVAAVAVVLGQVALLLHDIVVPHELATSCEICVGHDRPVTAAVSPAAPVSSPFAQHIVEPYSMPVLPARQALGFSPRGPPLL